MTFRVKFLPLFAGIFVVLEALITATAGIERAWTLDRWPDHLAFLGIAAFFAWAISALCEGAFDAAVKRNDYAIRKDLAGELYEAILGFGAEDKMTLRSIEIVQTPGAILGHLKNNDYLADNIADAYRVALDAHDRLLPRVSTAENLPAPYLLLSVATRILLTKEALTDHDVSEVRTMINLILDEPASPYTSRKDNHVDAPLPTP